MSINRLYHMWLGRLEQLQTGERITRLRTMAQMLAGIYLSRSVHLSEIAGKIPGNAKLVSVTRQLSRWLDNPAIRVREWYTPIAQSWLWRQAQARGEVRLIIDGSKVGAGHQLLMVALAYRRRAVPLVWTWVQGTRGHSSALKQLALLEYVRQLLPPKTQVLLVGDSEFGSVAVLRQLDAWRWNYVLRQNGSYLVRQSASASWLPFASWVQAPGQSCWLGRCCLTELHAYPVNLLAHWKIGETKPWLLATNLPHAKVTLRAYGRRMWVEEMFGDLKKHGFDLESTHLRHFMRLSRLTLLVALLYIWLMHRGAQVIKDGLRHLVDRKDRRDLSIFQIGLRYVERCLVNDRHLPPPLGFLFQTVR